MAHTMQVDIVSAEAQIFSGLAEMLVASAEIGEIGVLPGHSQLLTSIKPGQIRLVLPGDEEQIFYVSGGILEVQPDLVTVLADTAVRADDLDEVAVHAAKEAAEKALQDKTATMQYTQALAELAQTAAQIRAIQSLRKKLKK